MENDCSKSFFVRNCCSEQTVKMMMIATIFIKCYGMFFLNITAVCSTRDERFSTVDPLNENNIKSKVI